jgi:hypothetical protein
MPQSANSPAPTLPASVSLGRPSTEAICCVVVVIVVFPAGGRPFSDLPGGKRFASEVLKHEPV